MSSRVSDNKPQLGFVLNTPSILQEDQPAGLQFMAIDKK